MFEASPSQESSAYRPLTTLATVTCLALAVELLRVLTALLCAFVQVHATNVLRAGDEAARPILVEALHLQAKVAMASLPMMILIAVCFLLWFYRAHKNLASFRRLPLEYSHSAAAWSFVVPFASLIMPLWVMQEVWQGSDPKLPRGDSAPFDAPKSRLAEFWWGTFLLRGVLTWVLVYQAKNIKGLTDIFPYSYAQMASSGMALIAAVLAVWLVMAVSKRQELCSRLPAAPVVAIVDVPASPMITEEPSTA